MKANQKRTSGNEFNSLGNRGLRLEIDLYACYRSVNIQTDPLAIVLFLQPVSGLRENKSAQFSDGDQLPRTLGRTSRTRRWNRPHQW